jgi:hypothetical protein
MRPPRLRVRTLMLAVAAAALLISGGMMAARAFVYYRLAADYREKERGWRSIAARPAPDLAMAKFHHEAADYFTLLAAKYRHAMWHPWLPVPPDPYAPGNREWQEQEARKRKQ